MKKTKESPTLQGRVLTEMPPVLLHILHSVSLWE
jgi:hypothetical protein